MLPAPEFPHWFGETGIAVWGNVPESGDSLFLESNIKGNGGDNSFPTYETSLVSEMRKNGYYYSGDSAPPLPASSGLEWKVVKGEKGQAIYAVWNNLEDYEDRDTFNVCVYDKDGGRVNPIVTIP